MYAENKVGQKSGRKLTRKKRKKKKNQRSKKGLDLDASKRKAPDGKTRNTTNGEKEVTKVRQWRHREAGNFGWVGRDFGFWDAMRGIGVLRGLNSRVTEKKP